MNKIEKIRFASNGFERKRIFMRKKKCVNKCTCLSKKECLKPPSLSTWKDAIRQYVPAIPMLCIVRLTFVLLNDGQHTSSKLTCKPSVSAAILNLQSACRMCPADF